MKLEDALEVAKIHTFSWQHAYKGIVEQRFLDSIDLEERRLGWKRGIENDVPPSVRIVAEYDGIVIGFASGLENRKKTEMPHCDAELWAIYVQPEHFDKGAGKALLSSFKAELHLLGMKNLCIWALTENKRARRFYESQGGILRSSREIKIGDQLLPEVGYEFKL